jgi:hypothetical protein
VALFCGFWFINQVSQITKRYQEVKDQKLKNEKKKQIMNQLSNIDPGKELLKRREEQLKRQREKKKKEEESKNKEDKK